MAATYSVDREHGTVRLAGCLCGAELADSWPHHCCVPLGPRVVFHFRLCLDCIMKYGAKRGVFARRGARKALRADVLAKMEEITRQAEA